jgi:hypothetical protein
MAFGAFLDGIRRVAAAPLLLCFLYGVALAAALAMEWLAPELDTTGVESVRTTGGGLVGVTHAVGFDASALAVVVALGSLSRDWPQAGAVGPALAGMVLWTFLAGGALDRLAGQQWTGRLGFLAACRHHFWPLTRLAVLTGAMQWVLFGVLRPWLLGDPPGASAPAPAGSPYPWLALHGLLGAGSAAIGLVADYARVRAVVEGRRSAIGALVAALRFMARRPAPIAGLWLLNAVLLALLLTACSLLAPAAMGSGQFGPFLVGQIYTAAHLVATLAAWASQTAYFQDQLAHPTYVARARVADAAGPAKGGGAPSPPSVVQVK